MEPGDRQSLLIHSSSSSATSSSTTTLSEQQQLHLRQHTASRDFLDRRHRQDQPAMATATLLAPSAHYSSYTPTFSQHSSASSAASSTMISSEPRRHSDDNDSPSRQSLPSISEVISGTRPAQYPPPAQPNMAPGSGLPSPFPQAVHQYADSDKHPSPQPMHPTSSFPQRQDTLPAFVDSPRLPFNGRHSLPPVTDRRPTPPTKPDMLPQKPSDAHPANGAYPHPPPTSHPYQPGQLPAGQVPLPSYPISPRHAVPVAPGHYDPRVSPVHSDEADYANRARFDPSLNRHFEPWNYQESLSRIGSSSRVIFNFAEAYTRIAREQHGSQPIPERLPTEREVGDMLVNLEVIKRSFDQVKDAVQASIQSERAREGIKMKGTYEEDHDVPMYGDGMKPQYAMPPHEVKKRRGRAAPPGRCHSCNRIDTPEWRRGPDGARTLCNACGLHYAKLERKRQLEARSIRPKPEDRS